MQTWAFPLCMTCINVSFLFGCLILLFLSMNQAGTWAYGIDSWTDSWYLYPHCSHIPTSRLLQRLVYSGPGLHTISCKSPRTLFGIFQLGCHTQLVQISDEWPRPGKGYGNLAACRLNNKASVLATAKNRQKRIITRSMICHGKLYFAIIV